ncbi:MULTISPECIES: hypothetical protein [Limnospira]|uniref:DNA-binding protein n=1 Tax=Limnospira fusiformis PMC 851.14 TaxID=2219512 RepID=A0ABU9EN55_LIMFS|nr:MULTISPECIES: hypothetical protein [Limnospira]MDT9188464.1 hypothetical protein [Limnospira sp. PMC 894.15]MDT9235419.1 hypothetical protein [Limnospira sp. PMC 917.15]MDY7054019.1 hypothetical protein [Limnospira fusiformis LS22]QNH59446.1 MAG: hypothetical protein H2674_09705 [Limnospira indica BM01]
MTTFAIVLPPRFANRFHILLILLSLTPGMIGCRQIIESTTQFTRQTTKIEAIAQQRQVGSKIYIEGTVANLAPFVGAGAYQLQDSTATIWVFTTQPLPSVGEQMLIRGQVNYEQITVEGLPGLDIGDFYIQELERITDNQ